VRICVLLASSILTAALLLSFLPVRGEEQIYDSVIRLHVLAVSDSEEDQRIKLAVRDRVLSELTPLLETADTVEEAGGILRDNLKQLEVHTKTWMQEQGYTDPVHFSFTREKYPVRRYDDFSLPAGTYDSLRVILGEGEGKNWWCVLFPSVCSRFAVRNTEEVYLEAGFTPEQYRLITHSEEGTYQIRFRLLEILTELFDEMQSWYQMPENR